MKILFLVSSIGLAHIFRTLELARYIIERGHKIVFACGNRAPSVLLNTYGFDPMIIYESFFTRKIILGIGKPKANDLIKSYKNELQLIKETRPDLIVSDWRFTTWLSAATMNIPCVHIWNSSWGLLAGYPELVNQRFVKYYSYIISLWEYEINNFLKNIRGDNKKTDEFVFRGKHNIIPDHIFFRSIDVEKVNSSCTFVGPLVPWPDNRNSEIKRTHDITILFGGHNLSYLTKLIRNVASSMRLKIAVIDKTFHQVTNTSQFTFFPNLIKEGKVVVVHGGIGSIYQALLASKPILVLPQHLEHLDNGSCVEELGIGICLSTKLQNEKNIGEAIVKLMDNRFGNKVSEISSILLKSQPLDSSYNVIVKAAS